MNAVDGSDHYSKTSDEPPPSLLTIILDTNPHAWALLAPTLPLSSAIANLLVFINAHLAFNNANRVAVIASHTQRAEFLYPLPTPSEPLHTNGDARQNGADGDTKMRDSTGDHNVSTDANHYRPFHQIRTTLLKCLTHLLSTTSPSTLTPTTAIAGALTLALTHINKTSLLLSPQTSTNTTSTAAPLPLTTSETTTSETPPSINPRILILSVSADLAHQYIPIMNTIFAAQRLRIPISIAKLASPTPFLQQASDATGGTYIDLARNPRGLLQYLMMGFLPDQASQRFLVSPTAVGVDFRAACFCHRRVVDVGFVCSICLSIFCEVPEGAVCGTCGTHLALGEYGGKPAVVVRKKKKRKQVENGKGRDAG
ncbi:RNA polymerase II transcription factor B subunit 4 [Puttea exsequens]|nr:RNA polymerase II transcription factor B subunit 4 [Puttea exsequens]